MRALVLLLFANVCTLGVAGVMTHAMNGFRVGALSWIVGQSAPEALPWMWLYVPVEVVSFAVGGGAGLVVALVGVDWILRSAPVTTVIRPVVVAIACATGGLLVAAFLEAYAIQKAWG